MVGRMLNAHRYEEGIRTTTTTYTILIIAWLEYETPRQHRILQLQINTRSLSTVHYCHMAPMVQSPDS